MQNLSPASRYQQALAEGSYQPDDVQREAVTRLDAIWQALSSQTPAVATSSSFFGKLFGKRSVSVTQDPVSYTHLTLPTSDLV